MTAPTPTRTSTLDFEALYRAVRDDVYAYVATLLRDRAAAEDVTAAAFERAYRKQRSYKAARGSERAWLFGIARNAALDELRRRSPPTWRRRRRTTPPRPRSGARRSAPRLPS
jgi:RNA polymerase sigma-70 factor (ECF subfamily)